MTKIYNKRIEEASDQGIELRKSPNRLGSIYRIDYGIPCPTQVGKRNLGIKLVLSLATIT